MLRNSFDKKKASSKNLACSLNKLSSNVGVLIAFYFLFLDIFSCTLAGEQADGQQSHSSPFGNLIEVGKLVFHHSQFDRNWFYANSYNCEAFMFGLY